MALSPQWLDELRSRVTLSAIVSRNVRLQKAGREFRACCPFHNEKTPSFYVNDEKGFYHCFGCGAHGDAISWLTDQGGLLFMDAVKDLAVDAGMEVPAPDRHAAQAADQRATLHEVLAATQDWLVGNLQGDTGTAARRYLAQRGISDSTVQLFDFGFAPDARNAMRSALSQHGDELLIQAGLLIEVDSKEPYDRFRGRLMLPIHDLRGRVIGFAGRVLEGSSAAQARHAPKYLNSPETPLFDKGRTLYNLHRAAPAARKTGRVCVVEGYMDVIALAEAGIAEVVAPMGTALTPDQLALLWRLAPVPILCFDGDAAGQRAAMRALHAALPLLKPGHSLSFVTMPDGQDPDDILRAQGPAALKALLETGEGMIDFMWRLEHSAQQLHTPEQKAGLKQRLLDLLETIADRDIRALYRRDLLDRYGDFAFPRRKQGHNQQPAGNRPWRPRGRFQPAYKDIAAPSPRAFANTHAAIRHRLTAAIILGLCRHPTALLAQAERLVAFQPDCAEQARLLDAMLAMSEDGTLQANDLASIDIASILQVRGIALPDRDTIGGMRFAFLTDHATEHDATQELSDAISLMVEKPAIEAALNDATARFAHDPEGSWAEQQRLLNRKLEFERRLVQLAATRGSSVDPADASMTESRTTEHG
ncbi:DNA primase [Croceicoccus sp. F390]|uniref:DNA primase n=1 Tax=Croceicoccus esteveae TaxID=3075597 RepID=A0ABU2ZGA3_9SPHN|nr:DNA primase [Croceicoccus sp. F390]MDT0575103.1 DNA primase [Croceicoccus sp. F390]